MSMSADRGVLSIVILTTLSNLCEKILRASGLDNAPQAREGNDETDGTGHLMIFKVVQAVYGRTEE